MFSLNIQTNLKLCVCFLLANAVAKAHSLPRHNFSSCNCISLQSCGFFNTLIDGSPHKTHIRSVIKRSVCFSDGFNIFVCCPIQLEQKRNSNEKPTLDYIDGATGLNCPQSFSNEYNYDEYLKAHKVLANHHTQNPDNSNHNGVHNHAPVEFSEFVGCDPLGHSYHSHPPYHEHDSHGHQHIIFPDAHGNSHKNKYPSERVTARPMKQEHSSCGISSTTSQNSSEVYEWIIRLAYLNTTSRTISYRCMGTVISDQYVLTAAHCVDQLVFDLRIIYARVGDDTNFEDFGILEIIVHPNYNKPLFNNDVAILQLDITSQKRSSLKYICLPKSTTNILSGSTGVVAGWSTIGVSEMKSSTIRYINLSIMNNTECAIRYARYSENFETSIVITPTEFCAKAEAMNDVCEGDSGGPFMESAKTGRFTLLGIVAFGPKNNCGQSNLPGVYMRVNSYVDWIQTNII